MSQRRNDRSRQVSPFLVTMAVNIFSALKDSDYKPPVTIFLILLNVFIHLAPYPYLLGFDLSNIRQNCIHPSVIVNGLQHGHFLVNRIILSSLIHADDAHLCYNMISLCWKGINLEKYLNSQIYLKLVVFSLVTSHTLVVLMAVVLNVLGFQGHVSGYNSCAVGFSAVIFSLKYVWNSVSPMSTTNVMGINLPTKFAAWAELVVISLITPNASFLGHLAGILAGVLYMKYARHFAAMK